MGYGGVRTLQRLEEMLVPLYVIHLVVLYSCCYGAQYGAWQFSYSYLAYLRKEVRLNRGGGDSTCILISFSDSTPLF
jgi:hypothetical protein